MQGDVCQPMHKLVKFKYLSFFPNNTENKEKILEISGS